MEMNDQINFSEIEIKRELEKPLEMRCYSKIDFIRKLSYEEIIQNNLTEKYENSIDTFLSDSSPESLKVALELVHNFLTQKRPSDDKAAHLAKIIIEKSFGCNQMQCQELAKAVLCDLLLMNYDPIIKLIKNNLTSPSRKNIKKIIQYEIILQHLINQFGGNIQFESIDTVIQGLTTSNNPGIRNLAYKLMKDIYLWDKDNYIANQLLKEKDKEAIDYSRKENMPNSNIIPCRNNMIQTATNTNTIQMNSTNKNSNSSNCLNQNNDLSFTDYYFNSIFLDKLSAKHQKANEKKKLLEELTSFLTKYPQCIQNKALFNQFIKLFEILKNLLNENNTNIIISVIRLLSHLSNHFSQNEIYTSFLLDIIPKLLDKFNLSNEEINDEVHLLLNEIVLFNIGFDKFFLFIENISTDDNINYTINILTFALNQIKEDDSLNINSFTNNIIDTFKRLTVDDNELISNLAFKSIEILNMRDNIDVKNNSEIKKEELIMIKPEILIEETKIANDQSKGKTFRTIKKKKESLNKNQMDKDVKNNVNIQENNEKINEQICNKRINNNEIHNNKKDMKGIKELDLKMHSLVNQIEEKKEKDNKMILKTQLNKDDECLVGMKTAFNQILEEMTQANEEREKTEIPAKTEKEIAPLINYKKIKKENNLCSSHPLLPFSGSIQNDVSLSSKNQEEQNSPDHILKEETKDQSLISFEKKMELALKKEEEKPISISRKLSNDNINQEKALFDESQFEEIKEVLGNEIIFNMDSIKWESKKQAFEDLTNCIQSNCLPLSIGIEEKLFSYLKYKLKGFKETNFNINREAINLFTILFSSKKLVFNSQIHLTILNAYYEKLCDSKLKEQTNQLLITIFDIVGVNLTIITLISKLRKKPKVNVLKEYALFFVKCVEDYEITHLPIKELVELCKTMASNINPQVRAASISLLCSLYKYIGNDIKILIKDIKESTLKLIEAEFEKVIIITPDTSRKLKGKNNTITFDDEIEIKLKKNKSNELIPRQDITKKITPKILKDIRDGKWPEKKEACELIEKILFEAKMKIVSDGLGELFNIVKIKLSDGNKNVVRMIISLLGKLIEAIGSGFKSFTKQIALALLPNFADKMQLVRDECHMCLDKWVAYTGFDSFACYIPQLIKTENVELRIELLKVIMKNKEVITKQIGESMFKEMVNPLLLCLQDKSSLVRSFSEEMIIFSLQFINLNHYYNCLKDFKPAIEADLKRILTKLKNEEQGIMAKHESSSTLISSTITSIKSQTPVINHVNTPNNCTGNNIKEKDIINAKKVITTPISEQKKVQSIRVYKKAKQQLSNEDICTPINKTLSTTPTHCNKESITDITTNTNTNNNNNNCNASIIKSPNMNKISTIFHSKKVSVSKYQVFQSNINVKPNKDKRIEFDRKYKFTLETLTSDSENKLRDQVKGLFTEDYIKILFNEDFKQVVNSLQSLSLAIQNDVNYSYVIDNLDIILKIIGYKCNLNQNPLMVKALLEFFEVLYCKISSNVLINDTEANIIVCLLVDKLGVSNCSLKDHLQKLIDNYFLLITPGKAMILALNCALGKNIKIKAEILEILTLMYINQSIDIINKQFPRILSRFLSINDNNVKGKTIALFKEIYSQIHDELWNIIDINDKERECLEANLYDYQRDEEDEYVVSESDNYADEGNNEDAIDNNEKFIRNDYQYHNSSESSDDNTNHILNKKLLQNQPLTIFGSNYITNINNSNCNNNHIKNNNETNKGETIITNPLLGTYSSIQDQNELLTILKNLLSEDIQERVNTIIIIHEFICAKYDDNKEILIQNVDNIVTSFIEAMNILFANKKVEDIPVKFTKYLATVLCKIATNKELISSISYDILYKLSEEILSNYLIENLDKIGDNKEGSIIFRSLNSTMLRLLDNCNSSHIILCLLELVRTYRENMIQNKLSGLAIQCLIKLNENIDKIIGNIEVDKILLHFHLIICDMEKIHPDLQMKNQTDQMILRYIKNFINDIVKYKKEDVINDYIKGVKSHHVHDKYILKWIKNVLSSLNIYPSLPSNLNSSVINPSSKSNTALPISLISGYNNKLSSSNVNHSSCSSNNVIHVNPQSQFQAFNESSKEKISDKKINNGLKKSELIIEDLKSRMLKKQNLTRSNRNFNYSNLNTNDMNNTITELKKKWNDVNKKNKGK